MRPQDRKYTETHEWVRGPSKKEKEIVVGITDYAVSKLSDLVHIELPKVGEKAEQGNPFGEVESVKTVADLVSPVTGKIAAVNEDLADHLETLTEDPFEEGWLVKITIEDAKELDSLMTAKEYEEFLESSKEEEENDEKGVKKESDEEVDEDDFM